MKAKFLVKELKKYKINTFIEVPCSLLDSIINEATTDPQLNVINPANEAIAMGYAAGAYLATGQMPVLLTQNSGLFNTLNALTSLHQIYKIPLLYIVAWRGEPGTENAPEHEIVGKKQKSIMNTFDIPYVILSEKGYKNQIRKILHTIKKTKLPAAILLRRGVIDEEKGVRGKEYAARGISRNFAVSTVVEAAGEKAAYVSTNGYISRELFSILKEKNLLKKSGAFYMLGSMGHALPAGLGVERGLQKNKKVIVLDGDGGCLMHLGAMASVAGCAKPAGKLIHLVLDNRAYASTGHQPTLSGNINFAQIAKGCGYRNIYSVRRNGKLKHIINKAMGELGPAFIHVLIDDKGEQPKPRVSDELTCEGIKRIFTKLLS